MKSFSTTEKFFFSFAFFLFTILCLLGSTVRLALSKTSTKLRIFLIFLNFVFILLRGRSGSPMGEDAAGHHRQGCRGLHPWSFVV